MSDQPASRRPDDARQPSGRPPARTPGDDPALERSPLRTRRDPVTGEGKVVRPPSRQPSWNDDDARRGRGTGRYAAPTSELPPAVIPDGAPGWMGRRRRDHQSAPDQEPVVPRPLGGTFRRAEDYATGWREEGATRTSPSRPTGTWPTQPSRPPRPDDRRPPSEADAEADEAMAPDERAVGVPDASPRIRFQGSDRSGDRLRPARAARRSGIALLEDGTTARLTLLIILSAVVMWGLTRIMVDAVDDPLTLRLGADGAPSVIAGAGAIWRVPFVATMLALMSIGTGLLVAGRDRFAARFILGCGLLVQALIWVAAITLLR